MKISVVIAVYNVIDTIEELVSRVFMVAIKDLNLKSNRFGFEPEFTAKVAKKGLRIYETLISYSGRTYSEGKKITWKDGIVAIFTILWFHFFD